MTIPHTAEIFTATMTLLFVLDPFGNVPLVLSALAKVPAERRRFIVVRECVAAFAILAAFMIGGRAFLDLLQLSEFSLGIAGGIILFIIALRMVFHGPEGVFGEVPGGEPFLVPIAVPAIAGPSAAAVVMLMASRDPEHLGAWLAALTIAMLATLAVLSLAPAIQRVLGERGVLAVERLMGLVLTAIAIEMLLNGVRTFAATLR
jgi:small neutral amino acid transporter SnatA (MarC family)